MTRFGYDITTEGLDDAPAGPSKTRRKDDMHGLQDLGLALLDLPPAQFARIPMDERLRAAFDALARIKSHGARRRQGQYIGKLLRDVDNSPFEAALAAWTHAQSQAARGFPELSRWRDRLLADDAVLTEWCARFPATDTRSLRARLRAARREEAAALADSAHTGTPAVKGPRYRELFQQLRATAEAAATPE